MPHDADLAERMRELLAAEPGLSESKMFGGIAFLIHGHMAVSASGQGGIMVRVDPAEAEALVADTSASFVVMRGRTLRGWLRVGSEHLRGEAELAAWVGRGVTFARQLPAKRQST